MEQTVKTVIDLIDDARTAEAVAMWSEFRHVDKKCAPCFYSPLEPDLRCASCLESHLSHALLKRAYNRINPESIQSAQQILRDWLRHRDAA